MKKQLDIIFEDEHLIAINKNSGMLSIPDRFDPEKKNLKSILEKIYGEIFVVHRLDIETSGIILFAKTAEAHAGISLLLENRNIEKNYLALCIKPQEASGTIDEPIAESMKFRGLYKVHQRGKQAITEYTTVNTWQKYALLSLQLITGRTHQIRVHLRHIGAPLLADEKYGIAEFFYLSQIKKLFLNRNQEERPLLKRSSLHAQSLKFNHPITGDALKLEAPLPKDMRATINQLDKKFGTKG